MKIKHIASLQLAAAALILAAVGVQSSSSSFDGLAGIATTGTTPARYTSAVALPSSSGSSQASSSSSGKTTAVTTLVAPQLHGQRSVTLLPLTAVPSLPAPANDATSSPGKLQNRRLTPRKLIVASIIGIVGVVTAALIYTFLGPWGLLFVVFTIGLMEIVTLVKRDASVHFDASTLTRKLRGDPDREVESVIEKKFASDMSAAPASSSSNIIAVHKHFLGREAIDRAIVEAIDEVGGEEMFCEMPRVQGAKRNEPRGVQVVMGKLKSQATAFTDHVMDKLANSSRGATKTADDETATAVVNESGEYGNNEDADEDSHDDNGDDEEEEDECDDGNMCHQHHGHGHDHGPRHHHSGQHQSPPLEPQSPPAPVDDQEHTVWAGLKRVFRSWVRKTKEYFAGKRPANLRRRADDDALAAAVTVTTATKPGLRQRIKAWFARLQTRIRNWRMSKFSGEKQREAVHKRVAKRVERARGRVRRAIIKACRHR